MPRIYLPFVSILNNQISITAEKAHYLTSVLRCRKGDELIILDGEGSCLRSVIANCGKREVVAEVVEKLSSDPESPLDIILVQGILKGEKMDLVIQKTTELGVKGIIPAITERSQIRETRKIARWRKIAEESARQSGRSATPVVHEVKALGDFFSLFSEHGTQTSAPGIIFYEECDISLKDAVDRIRDTRSMVRDTKEKKLSQYGESCIMHHASNSISSLILHPSSFIIVVGPEGGFTKEEINTAKEKGFFAASLGKRILRAETAAISTVALVQFLFGDMGY
jgi:16S rRNA (uracil1498-N3)-methyltransferase